MPWKECHQPAIGDALRHQNGASRTRDPIRTSNTSRIAVPPARPGTRWRDHERPRAVVVGATARTMGCAIGGERRRRWKCRCSDATGQLRCGGCRRSAFRSHSWETAARRDRATAENGLIQPLRTLAYADFETPEDAGMARTAVGRLHLHADRASARASAACLAEAHKMLEC